MYACKCELKCVFTGTQIFMVVFVRSKSKSQNFVTIIKWVKMLKDREYMETYVTWKIILREILKKKGRRMWTGFTCFMIGSIGDGTRVNTLMHLLVSYREENLSSI